MLDATATPHPHPLVALAGFARSGKDTAARGLIEADGFERVAFADPIREALYRANPLLDTHTGTRVREFVDAEGWEWAKRKEPEVRRLLQEVGQAMREVAGEDVWVRAALKRAQELDRPVVFTDTRHENEAQAVRSLGGIVLRIERPGVGPVNDHVSDQGLPPYVVDRVIPNTSTPEALGSFTRAVVRQYGLLPTVDGQLPARLTPPAERSA